MTTENDLVPIPAPIPEEVREMMTSVIGEFDDSMTREQAIKWARYLNETSIKDIVETAAPEFADSLRVRTQDASFIFAPNTVPRGFDGDFAMYITGQAALALNVIYHGTSADELFKFIRTKSLAGFAGDKCPEHSFPAPDMWFEAIFSDKPRPMFPPRHDPIDAVAVVVSKVAIHAVCETPKKAQIVAWIELEDGQLLTYAGVIEYGTGGAHVFPVKTLEEARTAYTQEVPAGAYTKNMSGGAQFVAGFLAYLLEFAKRSGQSFEPMNPHTEMDVDILSADDGAAA